MNFVILMKKKKKWQTQIPDWYIIFLYTEDNNERVKLVDYYFKEVLKKILKKIKIWRNEIK